jgi:hypothetical protein
VLYSRLTSLIERSSPAGPGFDLIEGRLNRTRRVEMFFSCTDLCDAHHCICGQRLHFQRSASFSIS